MWHYSTANQVICTWRSGWAWLRLGIQYRLAPAHLSQPATRGLSKVRRRSTLFLLFLFFLLYYIKNKILALLSSSSTDQPLPIGITVTGASNVKSLREAGDV